MVVSVRDGEKDEMVVQINLNKFMNIENDRIYLTHNGAVTRSGARASELRQLVHEADNDMIRSNRIYLGSCYGKDILYVNSPELAEMIKRIITYAIIRDEYKARFSASGKKRKRI